MPIITLTSDWNKNDYYLGAIKGKILSTCKDVTIIDISHNLPSFNVSQAAFILRNCYTYYPKNTIHLIFVKSEVKSENPYLIVKANNQFFIAADNGIFSLIFPDNDAEIFALNIPKRQTTFPELDILTETAIDIANGKDIKDISKPVKEYYKQIPLRATIDDSAINGSVIFIDSYENIITNITRDIFNRVGNDRSFEIFVQSNHYKITKINNQYQETSQGELLAVFNAVNLLEIAINSGNVARLLNLKIGTNIRIKFK